MKKYILSILVLTTVGCSYNSRLQQGSQTEVVFNGSADSKVNVVTKANSYDIPVPSEFRLTIKDKKNNTEVFNTTFNDKVSVSLPRNTYKAIIETPSLELVSFENPMYFAEQEFEAATGSATQVDMVAKLNCYLVKIKHSDRVKSFFKEIKTEVWGEDPTQRIVFDDQTIDKIGYVKTKDLLNYTISVKTKEGYSFASSGFFADLVAGDLVNLEFDVDKNMPSINEATVFDIVMNRILNEVESVRKMNVEMQPYKAPVIAGRLFDLSESIGVPFEKTSEVMIDIATQGGLDKVLLIIGDKYTQVTGVKTPVINTMDINIQKELGIGFENSGGVEGSKSCVLDLTGLTGKLPGRRDGSEMFEVSIGVLDQNGQYTAKKLVFNVYGVPITTVGAEGNNEIDWFGIRGERNKVNVVFKGRYNVEMPPQNMRFCYRIKNSSGRWSEVDATIGTNKEVSATVGLPANIHDYEYFLAADDIEPQSPLEFSINVLYPVLENMNLDAWGSGDQANPLGFWGSPNYPGVVGIGKLTVTTPCAGWNGVGRGAQLKSGEAVSKFASGGLFTGTMSVDMDNPYKSAKVGVPFNGRPKKLVGYFKYNSVTLSSDSDGTVGNGAVKGEKDMCEIAIKLEKWGNQTYNVRWKDGLFGVPKDNKYADANGNSVLGVHAVVSSFDNNGGTFDSEIRKKISVGYGQLTSRGQADWTRFEIDIEYYQDVIPDRIIITSVSSAWGGYMTGSLGSTLCIDDLEFVW